MAFEDDGLLVVVVSGFSDTETDSFLYGALEYFQGGLTQSFTIE